MFNDEEIVALTREYGGMFGLNHTNRLIKLTAMLGEGMDYNRDAIRIAAHIHDWGAYPKWMLPGVDHAVRSTEVAREYLKQNDPGPALRDLVLECIEYHHGGPAERSLESKLFTDADALDLLGAIGFARVFSMVPRDIAGGFALLENFRAMSIAAITLDKSREIARTRLAEMDTMIAAFKEESFGLL